MANLGKIKGIGANIIVMLVIVITCFYYLFYNYLPSITNHGDYITVPDVRGMKVSEIEKMYKENTLRFIVVDSSSFNPNQSPSSVINQVPKADANVKENRKIYLTINARKAPNVPMPNLKNKSLRDALILLKSAGLSKKEIIYKPYIFQNIVIGQLLEGENISEEKLIPKGSPITLIVGVKSGRNLIPVPDLIGRNYKGLKDYLQGFGLILSPPNWVKNNDMTEGLVFKQSPSPSDSNSTPITLKSGSIIDVWISGEAPKDSIPN